MAKPAMHSPWPSTDPRIVTSMPPPFARLKFRGLDSGNPDNVGRRRSPCHSRRTYPLRSLARASLRSPTPARRQELSQFANNQMLTERYRLDSWPLFNLGDGGAVASIESDSLVRIQVYSALAFGSRGLYYYCW